MRRIIEQGGGAKAVIAEKAASFSDWLFRLVDRSTEDVTFLLDTDPTWSALAAQLD